MVERFEASIEKDRLRNKTEDTKILPKEILTRRKIMKIDPKELDRWIEGSDDTFDDPYWEGVYEEGWIAFENGKGETDVPYDEGTEEYDTWLNGLKDAKRSEK